MHAQDILFSYFLQSVHSFVVIENIDCIFFSMIRCVAFLALLVCIFFFFWLQNHQSATIPGKLWTEKWNPSTKATYKSGHETSKQHLAAAFIKQMHSFQRCKVNNRQTLSFNPSPKFSCWVHYAHVALK